jgi:hypothetical protein
MGLRGGDEEEAGLNSISCSNALYEAFAQAIKV